MKTKRTTIPVLPGLIKSGKVSGLRYMSDHNPGISRRRGRKGFRYYDVEGKPLQNADELRRIKALAIPPAWENVWISPCSDSHLQATGRDARGRKQYRYHGRWRQLRDETKYDRLILVGRTLPKLRARLAKDLTRPGLPRVKVVAAVVKLLETTLVRIGNEQYARENHSFGLTTMRDKHVDIRGAKVHFHFHGKSGKERELSLSDARLARIVKRCQDLPGQELFQYIDENGVRGSVGSRDVNEYLRNATGFDFTAKDFRTWAGTVLAARALRELGSDSNPKSKRNILKAVEIVARRLGNTRAVCRKSYIHPAILDPGPDGLSEQPAPVHGLNHDEAVVIRMLEQRLRGAPRRQVA